MWLGEGPMAEQGLAARIRRFLRVTGMSESAFGRCALGDPNLLRQVREGRSLTQRTEERIRDFLAKAEG
jgi:tRNA-dihydrouridine synthase